MGTYWCPNQLNLTPSTLSHFPTLQDVGTMEMPVWFKSQPAAHMGSRDLHGVDVADGVEEIVGLVDDHNVVFQLDAHRFPRV